MKITTLRYFDFAASRLLADGRMSGNNFSGWAGVVGPLDQQTGMLINIVDLKKLLADTLDGYDHRFLNAQLEDAEPSTLNVTKAIYSDLATSLPAGISMDSLALAELDENAVLVTPEAEVQIVRGGFSAAHRTHAPQLSLAENQARYGICNNPAGHGHNYQVEIALPPGESTPDDLWEQFDHRNLSVDLPELEGRNAVTEAIAALIALRVPAAHSVRVWETPDFFAEYLPGEDRYHLGRRYRFHAAHRLNNPHMSAEQNRRIYGKCNRSDPHGHTYVVQVTVKGQLDPISETAYDLGCLDQVAESILKDLDHTYLDLEIPAFYEQPTTGENIAEYLYGKFSGKLSHSLEKIQLWETPKNQFVASLN